MRITEIEMSKQAFIYGAIHMLANRLQNVGDKIDPAISTKQWFVLAVVSKYEEAPPNIGDIAAALGTSRQNIKKMANILKQRGFLELEKDKNDKRSINLFLTKKCEKYFKGREQQESEYLKNIFLGVDDEMLNALCNGMGKLIENLDSLFENTER